MQGHTTGNASWQTAVRIVTVISCTCVLAVTVSRPSDQRPPPGTRTAIETLAGSKQHGWIRRIPTDLSATYGLK